MTIYYQKPAILVRSGYMGIIGRRINIKKFPKSIEINGYIAFRIIDNSMEKSNEHSEKPTNNGNPEYYDKPVFLS